VRALALDVDVTRHDAVQEVKGKVLHEFGRLDVLVNNVGGFPTKPRPLVDLTEDDWERSFDENLKSVFLCCRTFAPIMISQNFGRIVNISSSGSPFTGFPGRAHFAAAKAGIIGLSRVLARELANANVTVNCVAPGIVDTLGNDSGVQRGWWEPLEGVADVPLGRVGNPSDIAAAVAFLSSDEAGWVTGQTIHVNGGSFMA
jgi:3-oxoacyl-[acyl-carrier protein] reductase